tara:strand:- start:346 stop:753 length:408 start_codon:yes stop_codon:yes gene_type:complete
MEEQKSSRKYNSTFRKKLLEKINDIKNKSILLEIFDIVKLDNEKNISKNKSGVYFNLNLLKDKSIEDINNIIQNLDESSEINEDLMDNLSDITEKLTYKQYSDGDHLDQYDNLGPRLSNQEKSILKKFKNLNENN